LNNLKIRYFTHRDYAAYDEQDAQQRFPIISDQKNANQPRDHEHKHKDDAVTNMDPEKTESCFVD